MTRRRVVITGIGAFTAIGHGPDGLWKGVCSGRSAVQRITRFDPSAFRSQLAAQINDFDPLDHMDTRAARRLDRFAQFGVAAAAATVGDAGVQVDRVDTSRAGVSLGSALGGISYGEEQHQAYLASGMRAVSPNLAIAVYGGASGANIAIGLGLRGPNLANANSCASGATAIGEALRTIRQGDADFMLAGGVEAPLAPLTFGAFSLIKAMSTRNQEPESACKPFDRLRDGFVMAEGAALLLLEDACSAQRRGARIYAELVGFGHTNDAYHMTAPRPDGSEAARAICLALDDAGVSASEVGYVNAHATGTPLGDLAEACALHRSFGEQLQRIPVSGTKGAYGHALGASGAIEAAVSALSLHHGFLPGTTNLRHADPACALRMVAEGGCRADVDCVISTSFGFGGTNAALVLRRCV